MVEDDKITTIRLHGSTLARFRDFKVHHRETDEECLMRLLDEIANLKNAHPTTPVAAVGKASMSTDNVRIRPPTEEPY